MVKGVQLENGKYGLRAVATSAWSDEITDLLLRRGVEELELNNAKGWRGDNVSFLAKLPRLEALTIIDLNIRSVAPIHFLSELRALEVITYCRTELRFSTFPRLEECALGWRPKASSLFGCATLKKLFVDGYDGKSADPFGKLFGLESLAILNSPLVDVRGLASLGNLRSLRLANLRRLSSLAGIERLRRLEELEIHTCRSIGSIDEIGALSQLRALNLSNDGGISSLKPLEKLMKLESILFYESTNILDGDLSPLLDGKHLARVSFQNRRHYSHRREDFGAAYSR